MAATIPTTITPRFIVITGGPGSGKTALLEMARHRFSEKLGILPESAGIIFGGGFPRRSEPLAVLAAQRAIFRVQRELEQIELDLRESPVVLCDRGTLDGLAYWPEPEALFFSQLETTLESELARYAVVIHLRTPSATNGYNHSNPLRVETAERAAAIDERIGEIWRKHPRYFMVESAPDFLAKVARAFELIQGELHQREVQS